MHGLVYHTFLLVLDLHLISYLFILCRVPSNFMYIDAFSKAVDSNLLSVLTHS